MMKKLVCLMIVALVSSVACAGTVAFQVPATVEVGEVVTVTVIGTDGVTSVTIPEILSSHAGLASNLFLNPLLSQFPTVGTAVNAGNSLITGVSGATPFGFPPIVVDAGATVYSFDFKVPEVAVGTVIDISGAGTMFFQLGDFSVVSEIASASMEVVPEPMTIALLGLGGLFIRRRK